MPDIIIAKEIRQCSFRELQNVYYQYFTHQLPQPKRYDDLCQRFLDAGIEKVNTIAKHTTQPHTIYGNKFKEDLQMQESRSFPTATFNSQIQEEKQAQYHSLMKEAVLDFRKGCCVCRLIRIKTSEYHHQDIDLRTLIHEPTKHKAPAPRLHPLPGSVILKEDLCRDPLRLPICDTCTHQLNGGLIPVKAIANGKWSGNIPLCIQRLNYMERIVLCPVQLRAVLITLSPHHGPNTYRGNMVSWPSNINKLHTVLPMSAHDTNALIQIVTVGFKEKVTPRVIILQTFKSSTKSLHST